jgi:hypothetical protein
MNCERLVDAKTIAEMLSVPVSWVREHTRSGAVPHVTLGRYQRYDPADVLAWVESLKNGGGPAFRKHQPRGRAGMTPTMSVDSGVRE